MRRIALFCALLSVSATLVGLAPARAAAPATFTNPVSAGVVDTFPDPAMIRGKDGLWYAYGTTNPIRVGAGDTTEHILPILRSPDLVTWAYVGDVYPVTGKPSWWPSGTRPWAPDIRYVDGAYHLTYSMSTGGIALVTGPTPTGPWTDHGRIVPGDLVGSGCPSGSIDQAMYTDIGTGAHYLYWGSYDTICVSRMNAAGTALTGAVTQIARGRRVEGGFLVRRDGMYYLFYSDAGCCDGAFSGYTVKVGRASSPLGPFTTPGGRNLMDLTSKDGIVVAANGNGWVGPGHNAIQTDLSGQDWLVYHAIPAANPEFGPVTNPWGGTISNLSRRPLMLDRLDWIDGWPVVRAGAGPSTGAQPAPVSTWTVGSTFNAGLGGWGTTWPLATDPDSAGHLSTSSAGTSLSTASVSGNLRVEGDLRLGTANTTGAVGLVVTQADASNRIVAWINRAQQRLVVDVTVGGVVSSASSPLPASFDYDSWHNVAAERRGSTLVTWVTADRLRDAVSTVTVTLPAGAPASGRIGAASTGGVAAADNVGAAPLYPLPPSRVPNPVLGAQLPAYSDEFAAAPAGWTWVRAAAATASGGQLVWPTQAAELVGGTNTASVLLRPAPAGNFVVETKLQFDGAAGNQQAGLVLYENDNRFFKLTHTVLPLAWGGGAVLHVTEFGKEGERPGTTPPTAVASAPMFGGPPAGTTWLRLLYRADTVDNEHDVRMASSTDGVTWTWGGTWSLPRAGALRIGLVSMNATGATARFDYVRTYALAS